MNADIAVSQSASADSGARAVSDCAVSILRAPTFFFDDLRFRVDDRMEFTTDVRSVYFNAVAGAFGHHIEYASKSRPGASLPGLQLRADSQGPPHVTGDGHWAK